MKCSESELLVELIAIAGAERVKTDPSDLTLFGKDWT